MLDFLCRHDKRHVENFGGAAADQFFSFLDEPLGRLACVAAGLSIQLLEDLFQALNLTLGLLKVGLERLLRCSDEAAWAIFGRASRICVSAL